jgi:hypothetical protein
MANPFTSQGQLYVPARGLNLAGQMYAGGEAIDPDRLEGLSGLERPEALALLHGDRELALDDYVRQPAPKKAKDSEDSEPMPEVGRRRSYASPDVRVPEFSGRGKGAGDLPKDPEAGRGFLPAELHDVVPDEDALLLSRKEAAKFAKMWNQAPPAEELAVSAKLGRAKRGWYKDAADSLVNLFGHDAPRVAALIAATSPVKGVDANLRNAIAIWTKFQEMRLAAGRNLTPSEVRSWLEEWWEPTGETRKGQTLRGYHAHLAGPEGGKPAYYLDTEINNIVRALSSDDPYRRETISGPKVDSFRANLLHATQDVTFDVWMGYLAGVPQKDFAGVGEQDAEGTFTRRGGSYLALAAKARQAAKLLNTKLAPGESPWTPAEVQETGWSFIRAMAFLQGTPRRRGAAKKGKIPPDPIEALQGLTNAYVHANADFVTLLLQDRHVLHNLKRLGLGRAVDQLREANEAKAAVRGPISGTAIEGLTSPHERAIAGTVARRSVPPISSAMSDSAKLRRRGRKARLNRPFSERLTEVVKGYPNAASSNFGYHRIPMEGGYDIHVGEAPQSMGEVADLSFEHERLGYGGTNRELKAESVSFLRQLSGLLQRLHQAQIGVQYTPVGIDWGNMKRAEMYERALKGAGFQRDESFPSYFVWRPTGQPRRQYGKKGRRRKFQRPSLPELNTRLRSALEGIEGVRWGEQGHKVPYGEYEIGLHPREAYQTVEVDFWHPNLGYSKANKEASAGSFEFLRHLQDLLGRLHRHQVPISYYPMGQAQGNMKRARIYERAVRAAGFEPAEDARPAAGRYIWVPTGQPRQQYSRRRRKMAALGNALGSLAGSFREGGTGRSIRRAVQGRFGDQAREPTRGYHLVEGLPGGRSLEVNHELTDDLAVLGFLSPNHSAGRLPPGAPDADTMAFLRQLQDLLGDLHQGGVSVGYTATTDKRARLYERAMQAAGFERDDSVPSPLARSRVWRPTRKPVRQYAKDGPPSDSKALVASSSNTEEEMGFDQAYRQATSGNQKAFVSMTDEQMAKIGLKGRAESAVGDWEDGAEHSVLRELAPDTDYETLKYAAAWHGLLGNQRAVLVFRPGHRGPDSTYSIDVPDTDVAEVRARLSAAGVPFRTIVPGKKGTRVVVFDQGRQWRDNVAKFAGHYGAHVRESIGQGEYIGGGSRAAARRAYRDLITRYEAARQAGGPVHKGPPQGPDRGRGQGGPQAPQGPEGRAVPA